MKRVKDELQLLENKYIKKPLEEKDYLEKKLSNVKKREEYVKSLELQFLLKNFDKFEDIDLETKYEVAKILKKKYPQYAYLIKIEDPNDNNNRSSRRRYSSISSTPHIMYPNLFRSSISEESQQIPKTLVRNFTSNSTVKEDIKVDDSSEEEGEKVSYQEKYSGLINPKLETITIKNKKNVVKKESKAVTKIIQVSNDLRKWTDDNLSKKQIEPLEEYLGRTGHNIFEGKKSYRLSLPSITNIKEEEEEEEENQEEHDNRKNKKKKNKKDNEFDILLNACRLMVLDSKPPMPIHVTEEHNTPYEFIEKITNNLGVDISKVKQAKNKIKYKKKINILY
ncbi:hypothetical protein PIROE2DRAFT_11653 [Piromyces sp. E2]|nr:hypothetical protein PIROE2DRAFT_11653 [Piromyces sp. E2]|eukprot:OUM62153.1 hypothetical protein PIROE2DRAFT_11653 [Piromyces sp. E2]